jgi:hypothetical protein
MKKLSKKSVLLFAAVMALCAFAMPAMASAANWDPAGSHTITSPALSLEIPALNAGSSCHAAFVVDANGTSQLTVTSATFSGCVGTKDATGCDVHATQGSGPDWVVDGANASAIRVTNINVDYAFIGSLTCVVGGNTVNVAGTLTAGGFNNSTHSLCLTGSTGLQGSLGGMPLGPVTLDGCLTDTAGTLTLS